MKEYFLRAIDLRLSAVRQDLTTAYATASASKTGKSRENLTVGLCYVSPNFYIEQNKKTSLGLFNSNSRG
jgi:hypothetical protein